MSFSQKKGPRTEGLFLWKVLRLQNFDRPLRFIENVVREAGTTDWRRRIGTNCGAKKRVRRETNAPTSIFCLSVTQSSLDLEPRRIFLLKQWKISRQKLFGDKVEQLSHKVKQDLRETGGKKRVLLKKNLRRRRISYREKNSKLGFDRWKCFVASTPAGAERVTTQWGRNLIQPNNANLARYSSNYSPMKTIEVNNCLLGLELVVISCCICSLRPLWCDTTQKNCQTA